MGVMLMAMKNNEEGRAPPKPASSPRLRKPHLESRETGARKRRRILRRRHRGHIDETGQVENRYLNCQRTDKSLSYGITLLSMIRGRESWMNH